MQWKAFIITIAVMSIIALSTIFCHVVNKYGHKFEWFETCFAVILLLAGMMFIVGITVQNLN